MKRIVSFLIIVILLASLSGCGTVESPSAAAISESPNSVESSAVASTTIEPIIPEDAELAAVLRLLRDADPNEVSVEWLTSDDGTESKLRITSELFTVIADILAAEPYTVHEEFPRKSYRDASLNVNFPVSGFTDERSSIYISLDTLSDNPENGEFAGKTVVRYNAILSKGSAVFSYPMSTYEKLSDAIQVFINTSPMTLDGNYIKIESSNMKEAGVDLPDIHEVLQFDRTLVVLWTDNYGDSNRRYGIEALDAITGTSLYFFAFDVELPYIPHIEKTDAAPYDYRINYRDRIEYRSSTDKNLLKTVSPPDLIKQSIWDSADLYGSPFDADTKAGLFTYNSDDGIYLCGMDGSGNKQILSNTDIPAIISASETPDHDASQLKYSMPLLMNSGKQIVAPIYIITNGDYDTAPFGVTVVDLDTGGKQSRTDIVWLSYIQRVTPKTVGYISAIDGFIIWDAETKETRVADFNWHEADSFDFVTFIQPIASRIENGEPLYTLYSYTLENPDNRTTLLTARNGRIGRCSLTEDYVICLYDDDLRYVQKRGYVIVPYNPFYNFVPAPGDDNHYLEVVDAKEAIVETVQKRVEEYKNGRLLDNPNHHPPYPSDYPPVSELREVKSTKDFAVRFAGNPDALESVYIAVPIGDDGEYELHMTVSQADIDGQVQWTSGNTFFERVSDIKWHKQDIGLYN